MSWSWVPGAQRRTWESEARGTTEHQQGREQTQGQEGLRARALSLCFWGPAEDPETLAFYCNRLCGEQEERAAAQPP